MLIKLMQLINVRIVVVVLVVIVALTLPFTTIAIAIAKRHNVERSSKCTTPLSAEGTCVSLKQCPEILKLYQQLPVDKATQYSRILQRLCHMQTTADNYPIVCCTNAIMPAAATSEVSNIEITETPIPIPINNDKPTNIADESRVVSSRKQSCVDPNMESGICKRLSNCEPLLNQLIENPNDNDFTNYLQNSNLNCNSRATEVCCPRNSAARTVPTRIKNTTTALNTPTIPRRFPTEEEGCGFTNQPQTKVVGGETSEIGAWPWIALIGYDVYSLAPFRCGGTLVTSRHVITAAHCIRSDLSFVRLGEFDLSIETETTHVDINVAKMRQHPHFGVDKRHDVAVLLLEEAVTYSDTISPICMPSNSYMRTRSLVGSRPFVAGWGRTEENGNPSHVLQQLQIPVLENSICHRIYEQQGRLKSQQQFDQSVICAGILSGGEDTCHGDSGGPLMLSQPFKGITRYYLIGIVSYGIGCGRIGIPAVYANVRHLLDWIENAMLEM